MVVRKPHWEWVYIICAAGMGGMFVFRTIGLSHRTLRAAELLILGILFASLEAWLRFNRRALFHASQGRPGKDVTGGAGQGAPHPGSCMADRRTYGTLAHTAEPDWDEVRLRAKRNTESGKVH